MAELSEYCKTCGMCCKYPMVMPEEREKIAAKAGILGERHIKGMNGYFVIDSDPCIFLKNGRCEIENIKPVCCRVFPLVIKVEKGKVSWAVSDSCPISEQIPKSYIRKAKEQGKGVMEFHMKRMGLK